MDYEHLVTGEVTGIRENGATSGVGVVATFAYDDLGRRTLLQRGNGTDTSYGYDPVSRLAQLGQDLGGGTAYDLALGFSYNPASQIKTNTRDNDRYSFTGLTNGTTAFTVNGLNQLVTKGSASVTHDTKGNLTSDGTETYGYSSENLLTSVSGGHSLTYDSAMRLYQLTGTGTTRFGYDGLNLIAEYDGANALTRRFVHGPGVDEPLVQYDGSGTANRKFLHADERGSIVALSDDAGNVTGINRYDEYGVPQGSSGTGTLLGRFGYTGQAWLPEIGLYYYKARMYDPKLGRFMQTDPIGYDDGMNMYAYVGNDPVNKIDPTGLAEVCWWVPSANQPSLGAALTKVCAQLPESEPAIRPHLHEEGGGGEHIVVIGQKLPKKRSPLSKLGQCAAAQFGIDTLLAGATAASGLPKEGTKRFVTQGSSKGTSRLSETLARLLPHQFKDTLLGQLTGAKRAWTPRPDKIRQWGRATSVVGRAVGRLIPISGGILLAYDLGAIVVCSTRK